MASRDEDVSTNISGREPTAPMPFASMTLEEENMAGGWNRITSPVGGTPQRTFTAGSRGDPDMDADNTLVPYLPKSQVTDEP